MMQNHTTIQERVKQSAIHHLMPSNSPIEGDASIVVRYQKNAVSLDSSHSGIGTDAFPSMTVGQVAKGSGDCIKIKNIFKKRNST